MAAPLALRLARATLLGGVAAASLGLAGCATGDGLLPPGIQPVAAINGSYRAGEVDIPVTPLPSLDDVINSVPSKPDGEVKQEDRLRGGALREAALSYGMRAGLAWESRNINRAVMNRSAELSTTYDFNRLLIRGPDAVKILPPVISEARSNWESQDAGKTLRVADTVYEIMDQARFTAVAPMWQTYVVRDYKTPEPPPDVLLPRDGEERAEWARAVKEGWELGRKQAQEIFQADLDRLERDFSGMVRYRSLLEEGKVSPPVLADARLGTTGSGQDMRVNDRAVRITQDPSLNVAQPRTWQASATTPGADGAPTNPGALPGMRPTIEAPGTAIPSPPPPAPAVAPAGARAATRAALAADAASPRPAPTRRPKVARDETAWHPKAKAARAAAPADGDDSF